MMLLGFELIATGTVSATPAETTGNLQSSEIPVPSGAPTGGSLDLGSISCPSAGVCAAVGTYTSGGGRGHPIRDQAAIAMLAGGSWSSIFAPLPPGANTTGFFSLQSVSCPTAQDCVAVGYYSTSTGEAALVETGSGANWTAYGSSTASAPVPLPADAAQVESNFETVSCESATLCVAAGTYEDSAGNDDGVLDDLGGNQTEWTSTSAPLPGGGTTSQQVEFSSVTCDATRDCAAVGNYRDVNGHAQPLFDYFDSSVWAAVSTDLPSNANGNYSDLEGVSCPPDNDCIAVGYYETNVNSDGYPLIETLSGGVATLTTTALVPGDAYSGGGSINSLLESVSCPSDTYCVATGEYVSTDDAASPLVDTITSSGTTPYAPPLPAGSTDNINAGLNSVACPSADNCAAAGFYDNGGSGGGQFALVDTLSATGWSSITGPLPSESGSNAFVQSVSCTANGGCVVVGGYEVSGGDVGLAEEFGAVSVPTCSPTLSGAQTYAGSEPNTTASCTISGSASLTGGTLSVEAPSSLSWNGDLSGTDQQIDAPATLEPVDATASGAGWELTASSTAFSGSAGEIPAPSNGASTLSLNGDPGSYSSFTSPGDQCAAGSTCTLPASDTDPVTYPVGVGATAAVIYTADQGSGLGAIDLSSDWWLYVPAATLAGTYNDMITLTISTGP
jgi:hypothetical protein